MTTHQWAQTVRDQIGLGRVLPLGGPADPAWITERAAADALRAAVSRVPGLRLGALRLDSAGPAASERALPPGAPAHAVPSPGALPPGALPRGPLRMDAAFCVAPGSPIPAAADRLRRALWKAAHGRVGLDVAAVELTVTGLLDGGEPGRDDGKGGDRGDTPGSAPKASPGAEFTGAAAAAVSTVPGVAGLSSRLGGFPSGVRVRDDQADVQIAVTADHRALDVALGVRDALVAAVGVSTVTVVVSELA